MTDTTLETRTARQGPAPGQETPAMKSPIELDEDTFAALFRPRQNHLDPHAGWSYGDGPGCLFETFGEELEFVRSQDPLTVWTLVDGDEGQYIISGLHFVNRFGYFVCAVPLPENVDVEVPLGFDGDEGPDGVEPSEKPYSVLLLYPDYLDDTGYETFFTHVEGADAAEAVRAAQREAASAQGMQVDDPGDFRPLLVIEGHPKSEPLFNK